MLAELRKELSTLWAQLQRKETVAAMLENLQNEQQELVQHTQSLKVLMEKEQADVSRLEKLTATSVFYSILGKKEEKLEKEQQQAYAAGLKFRAAMRQLEDCKSRLALLLREQEALLDCEKRYEEVFAQILELLRKTPAYAQRICEFERQAGQVAGQLKELDEAIQAGESAMQQIQQIESNLDSAESWGVWDLFGGGALSDMIKHSHLDEAQAGVEQLQVQLSRFHTELSDVHIHQELKAVNIDGLLRFADYFFDGLIADWSVLSHIQESLESVRQVKQEVEDVLSKLYAVKEQCLLQRNTIKQQITDLAANS